MCDRANEDESLDPFIFYFLFLFFIFFILSFGGIVLWANQLARWLSTNSTDCNLTKLSGPTRSRRCDCLLACDQERSLEALDALPFVLAIGLSNGWAQVGSAGREQRNKESVMH